MAAAIREIINKMDGWLFPLVVGVIIVWLSYKEGLRSGAEGSLKMLEDSGIIEIDSQGIIRSTKWEYVYEDVPDDDA